MINRIFSFLVCLAVAIGAAAQQPSQPKYIFYFIGDGMGLGHVMTAETYNSTVLRNPQMLTMMQFPVASVAMTYPATPNKITDSAAAGTALATGSKTHYGMLGVNVELKPVNSIAHDLKQRGWGVAIASSVPADDATPGAFYAHVPERHQYADIALQLAHSDYDMIVGGALRGIKDGEKRGINVLDTLQANGYTVARGLAAYERVKGEDKIILLNNDPRIDHFGFTIDSIAGNLDLPYVTRACLDHLQRVSPDHFFMMVEGGNIDWAAHANDAGTVVKEIVNFNQAIQVAYDFYLQHPDETLIVVTADHNTGGMHMGLKGTHQMVYLENLDYQRVSIDVIEAFCRQYDEVDEPSITWDDMKAYLQENFGLYGPIAVTEEQDANLQHVFNKVFVENKSDEVKTLYSNYNAFVVKVFELLDRINGIGWTSYDHCGDFVPVYAVGVGCQLFAPVNNNTDIPQKMRQIVGI